MFILSFFFLNIYKNSISQFEYYLRIRKVPMATNKHTVSRNPIRSPIKHLISQSLKMSESCSATAWSLTRSRPHRLASLLQSLSPSSSPRRSFHGNSRISSGFHGGGHGNVSHNASGFEYRCVTNSRSLHSWSVLVLHCVKKMKIKTIISNNQMQSLKYIQYHNMFLIHHV